MLDFLLQLPINQLIILYIISGALIIQLVYYLLVYGKVIYKRKKSIEHLSSEPVSVIICAKNEEQNLRNFLPVVLKQNYSNYEVIVVNDCSQDNTEMFLAELEQTHKKLRHTTIEPDRKFRHGKKLAVTIGIKSAKNNFLVFTDADCVPVSENWLQKIMSSYNEKTEVVLGYGKYKKTKGLLNRIVRYDTLMIGLQYLGMALLRSPYMGVGRNMSYKKDFFFAGKGFGNHYHIMSGDDDLFINEHSNRKNTAVAISKDSITESEPPQSFMEWVKQKKRHLSTAKYYKLPNKLVLGLEPLSKLVFYLALIYLCLTPIYYIGIGIYVFRLLVQLIIVKIGMNKLTEKGFLLLIPFLDIFLPIFQLTLMFSNKLNAKKSKWN